MDRIIIAISELSKANWVAIYKFIKSIFIDANIDTKRSALESLQSISNGIRFNSNENSATAKDVYSLYGMEISDNSLIAFEKKTCFSILYQKENDREDFTELVPFILIQQEFGKNVTLGIDICELNDNQRSSYKFKCSDFFILHDEQKPKLGNKSIYFIERTFDRQTGELGKAYTVSLAGKGKSGDTKYQGNISRRFLPLIYITKENYDSLFGYKKEIDSKESLFVRSGIKKIENELKKVYSAELDMIFDSGSLFGKWFESGFFYSYDKDELKSTNLQIERIRNTLQIFKESIQELVQNIMFHGGGNGMFYCVFDKKSNLSESYGRLIPFFENYNDSVRFLRIGIFDFNENGIVDTFGSNENVKLKDFFDINSIVTTKLTRLDLRYAAQLGLKTFVKTIADHNGYFGVESCEHHNGIRGKKVLNTIISEEGYSLDEKDDIDFVNGTHYEIILPVVSKKRNTIPVQTFSTPNNYFQLLNSDSILYAIKMPAETINVLSQSKDEQIANIKKICNEIIEKVGTNNKEIALDLANSEISSITIFKIAAYLQLASKSPLEKIILVNVTNEFDADFCSLIVKYIVKQSNGKMPLWKRDCAIILISNNLHVSIVWGNNEDELYFINREYKKMYYSNFLDASKREDTFDKDFDNSAIDKKCRDDAKRFVHQYDMLISSVNNNEESFPSLLFEGFLTRLLKRDIVSNEPGVSVNNNYTYIGRKIIVKNFYEADTLFQNNFFVERFAYMIIRNLSKHLPLEKIANGEIRLVLVGYKYYSEFLLKTIQRQLSEILVKKHEHHKLYQHQISLVICNNSKESDDTYESFNFNIDDEGDKTKKNILENPNHFLFTTIVPIGATLSTNDKIISFFNQWFEKEKGNIALQQKLNFVYNHCVVVVRDKIEGNVTKLESGQKWKSINHKERCIETDYQHATRIYYTIQIADKKSEYISKESEERPGNWIQRLNKDISFPTNWAEEKYVNLTENSSINSQNLMGFPKVYIDSETTIGEEEQVLEHIYNLKDFLYKGHIEMLNCHHKFYIDTESFVRQKKSEVEKWLHSCIIKKVNATDILNVLITPNIERESDFVTMVNNIVFNGNALIVYLDVNNWRNNIAQKLSFLNPIKSISFHYVDHAFLTGGTYFKSKNFIYSIMGNNHKFCSVFTIVNRLPYNRENEIRETVEGKLFAYVNLYYPTSKAEGQECELCQLEKYYEELSKKTVLDSCAEIIHKHKNKLRIAKHEEKKSNRSENESKCAELKRRIFLRLIISHWLYYRISSVANSGNNFETKKVKVKEELDSIYLSLCGKSGQDNLLNKKLGQWYNKILFEENKELTLDKKISFLKVISSPPLSQYIAIREYAHNKLLTELDEILNKKRKYVEDDLMVVKSILKSLSFLKSNALVRKDVIVGVWKVLLLVVSLYDENKRTNTIKDFSKDVQFFIKNSIVNDEAKATFLGELLRRGKEIENFENMEISKTRLSLSRTNDFNSNPLEQNDLFCVFSDCEYDIFRREYISFLVWLFYDNTTIIRNTLKQFSKETYNNKLIHDKFYDNIDGEDYLKNIDDFGEEVEDIKRLFLEKVNVEYYYSSFKPYLKNEDGINFVEKLIYVTYAKHKLEELISKKHKTNIEGDTRDLMKILSAIMGADAAFLAMKKDRRIFPVSSFGKFGKQGMGWDYSNWIFDDKYFTNRLYTYRVKNPLFIKYDLKSNSISFGECTDLYMHSIGVYLITDSAKKKRLNTGASFSFLYNEENSLVKNEIDYRINFQESGRLLLLLKNEISKYVIDFLIKDKVFDLWVDKYVTYRKFEKAYSNSAHTFRSVYNEMDEFENFDDVQIRKLSNTWFFLTNETINFLYSNIERNICSVDGMNGAPKHKLNLFKSLVIDEDSTIGKTFNLIFINLLNALLEKKWNSDGEEIKNTITINRKSIKDFKNLTELSNVKTHCNKHLLRTFIVQCLHNSLSPFGRHGHRGQFEIKNVNIELSESSIIIEDSCLKEYYSYEEKVKRAKRFEHKKKYIKQMNCEEFSSTTLTSLQGFVNYMQEYSYCFNCDYGFNSNYDFKITIKFSDNGKDNFNY